MFGLVNMNARLYDPVLGRFLAADLYVQSPDFSQSFNRYTYALNNPLMYVDESGEVWWLVPAIVAAVFAVGNTVAHAIRGDINNFGDFCKYFGTGAVVGFAVGCTWQFAPALGALGKGFQTVMTVYAGLQVATGVVGMVYNGINEGWSGLGKSGKIFLGNFYLDERNFGNALLQGLTRHSWEIPQQLAGNIYLQFKKKDDVQYLGGATFAIERTRGSSVSLGSMISLKTTITFSLDELSLAHHEYRHYYQSRLLGFFYLLVVGIPSAAGAEYTENWADQWKPKF